MNLNWIEINLPWQTSYSSPEYPDTSSYEKEKFGYSIKELDQKYGNEYSSGEYWRLHDVVAKWLEENPPKELLDYYDQDDKMQKENSLKCFCGLGLNNPGTLIELENGKLHLIGTINTNTGLCDDCSAFDNSTIIKRYAVVFDFKENQNDF